MYTIRQCTDQDLTAVVELSELWVKEGIAPGLQANYIEFLQRCMGEYFWIAEAQSAVVGFIFGTILESDGLAVIPEGEKYIEIDEVYVHPEWRSGGIGHELVDRLLQQAESNGVTRSLVYSAAKQWVRMVGFYEKHGFQMWHIQMVK